METVSVRCNHCGAPLEVTEETRFVTCSFCNTQLAVRHTDNSHFTEEIGNIARSTERMAASLEVIKLQNEIEQLDREYSTRFPVVDHGRGAHDPPGFLGAILGVIFAVVFSIIVFTVFSQAPGGFGLVPPLMASIAIIAAVSGLIKAGNHQNYRSTYESKRNQLKLRLDSLRSQDNDARR